MISLVLVGAWAFCHALMAIAALAMTMAARIVYVDLLMKVGCTISQIAAMNGTSNATATILVVRPVRDVMNSLSSTTNGLTTAPGDARLKRGRSLSARHFSELGGGVGRKFRKADLKGITDRINSGSSYASLDLRLADCPGVPADLLRAGAVLRQSRWPQHLGVFRLRPAVPWWLAGLSMVATTFSADTPNLVTDIVRRNGVAGNWVWWAFVLTGVATVFFYARLWRRSGVLTDLEFYELRYSGAAACAVRGFRALYLGFFFNCMIMAAVNLAALQDRRDPLRPRSLADAAVRRRAERASRRSPGCGGTGHRHDSVLHEDDGGDRGSVLCGDVPAGRRAHGLVTKVSAMHGAGRVNYLDSCRTSRTTGIWRWRSSSCRSRCSGGRCGIRGRSRAEAATSRSACSRRNPRRMRSGAVLFFNVAHYVLRPWPWILVALCSLIVYPELSDIQRPFPTRSELLGHDIAYPAMLKFLPDGFLGPDGGRADRGELVDDPHASELGRVVSRARLLPAIREEGRA